MNIQHSLLKTVLACSLAITTLVASSKEMVSIGGAEVNMRSGPGTRYSSRWLLGEGYPLEVLGRRGAWLRVRDFEGDKGWIYRSLTNRKPHVVVDTAIANLRAAPSRSSSLVMKAARGDVLRILERRKGWILVRHERGTKGWIARRLVWGW
ncbi:Peptide-binding protein [Burkholderiales bacterium 8X]|nr:Peptide-binding protein [Burkholderiales bacterium 8X]